MNTKTNPMETDADVERAWVGALSDEQIDDPMHTTPSEGKRASYSSDADNMMTIARSTIKGSVAVDTDCIHTLRTPTKVQTQIKKTINELLQLGSNSARNGIIMTSARLQETILL